MKLSGLQFGSSPLARGARMLGHASAAMTRIIPARAGSTRLAVTVR